jgi:mono/diheme cytochrome c family protein
LSATQRHSGRFSGIMILAVAVLLPGFAAAGVGGSDAANPPATPAGPAIGPARVDFEKQVRPTLEEYCYACHGLGGKKGGVAFDGYDSDEALRGDRDLWLAVLKNVRAGLMPPPGKPRPDADELRALEDWIKFDAFGIDPQDPDPGRVTVRRLNRVEYRNTIRDLLGVDYDTNAEFPPDDTGHGFDNIGEVLTISPLLLEKYLAAAREIVARAVPTTPRVVAERSIPGGRFGPAGRAGSDEDDPPLLSYYEPKSLAMTLDVEHDGRYQLTLDLTANEKYTPGLRGADLNKCLLTFRADGEVCVRQEFIRQQGKPFRFTFERDWRTGPHELTLEITPLTPGQRQTRSLTLRIDSLTMRGPFEERLWVQPATYARFFPRPVPDGVEARRAYARELLGAFATRAFRRPVDTGTADRLANLAESYYTQDGQTFEAGIAHAMTAVIASPRFLFREEDAAPGATGPHPLIDEYALASRLSYFLWSSMPDEELFRLAGEGRLRANLKAQVERMLTDPRAVELTRHFVGQWLQARDVEAVPINAGAVLAREQPPDLEAGPNGALWVGVVFAIATATAWILSRIGLAPPMPWTWLRRRRAASSATREVALGIAAGQTPAEALAAVAVGTRPRWVRRRLERARSDVLGGRPWVEALRRRALLERRVAEGLSAADGEATIPARLGELGRSRAGALAGTIRYALAMSVFASGLAVLVGVCLAPQIARLVERAGLSLPGPAETLVAWAKAAQERITPDANGDRPRVSPRDVELNTGLRRAMRRETEMLFEHIVRDDRSLLELLDCDYTFLNERLAKHYGIEGVTGAEMRRVALPAGSQRGGVLTQGTVLVVTSNPDRTSPVKRGRFLLDNILGAPPPPPPPNIPALDEAATKHGDRPPTLRETLELHRSNASCASCHARMDPLGLALENFNALGRWRDEERDQRIDTAGTFITGEAFAGVRDLKRILVNQRRREFYRCLSEKLLTYALGRGLDAGDVWTIDELVERLESSGARASVLILGIIESTPFQKIRRDVANDPPRLADRAEAASP